MLLGVGLHPRAKGCRSAGSSQVALDPGATSQGWERFLHVRRDIVSTANLAQRGAEGRPRPAGDRLRGAMADDPSSPTRTRHIEIEPIYARTGGGVRRNRGARSVRSPAGLNRHVPGRCGRWPVAGWGRRTRRFDGSVLLDHGRPVSRGLDLPTQMGGTPYPRARARSVEGTSRSFDGTMERSSRDPVDQVSPR